MDEAKILELAREAGLGLSLYGGMHFVDNGDGTMTVHESKKLTMMGEKLLAFARLVAAAEREACAKICDAADAEDMTGSNEAAYCASAIRSRTE